MTDSPTTESRHCPDCDEPMERTDTGYASLWDCRSDDCGNFDSYWDLYDPQTFAKVKAVQEAVGQHAAERLASEFKDGVLA